MSIPRSKSTGFTLIEMLIIAPLAIILVSGLIAAIVAMTSKVMISQARNDIAYSSNKALDQIEADTHLSLNFMSNSGSIAAPQGSGGANFTGSGSFSSSSALILETLATDRNPLDSNKKIVYYANQPNACGATESVNTPMTTKNIYFLNGTNLFRRIIVPYEQGSANTCSDPWQINTCTNGYSGGTSGIICGAKDELMADSVASFNVDYYMDPADAAAAPKSSASAAKGIEATINTEKQIAGETVTASYSIRASLYDSGE
ncbi:MAG: hypothetical protein L0H36_03605 [bacterium]|nr:hypothetical protein [bacterium]